VESLCNEVSSRVEQDFRNNSRLPQRLIVSASFQKSKNAPPTKGPSNMSLVDKWNAKLDRRRSKSCPFRKGILRVKQDARFTLTKVLNEVSDQSGKFPPIIALGLAAGNIVPLIPRGSTTLDKFFSKRPLNKRTMSPPRQQHQQQLQQQQQQQQPQQQQQQQSQRQREHSSSTSKTEMQPASSFERPPTISSEQQDKRRKVRRAFFFAPNRPLEAKANASSIVEGGGSGKLNGERRRSSQPMSRRRRKEYMQSIDPNVLAELPEEIRRDIQRHMSRNSCGSSSSSSSRRCMDNFVIRLDQ